MKNPTFPLKGLIAAILCNIITIQGMELSQENTVLLDLDALNKIFFCQPFTTSIKSFKNLSCTSKDYKNNVTFENILAFHQNPIGINDIFDDARMQKSDNNNRIDTLKNVLLERAVLLNDPKLVATLFDHGANPNAQSFYKVPAFFYARDLNVAQMFTGKQVNKYATKPDKTNVLWEALQHKYQPELLAFYLEQGISPKNTSSVNNSCLFHELAILCQTIKQKNLNPFFVKVYHLFQSSAKEVLNTININGQTPLDEAQKIFNIERNYAQQVNTHRIKNDRQPLENIRLKALQILMNLYKKYGGATAEQLMQQYAARLQSQINTQEQPK